LWRATKVVQAGEEPQVGPEAEEEEDALFQPRPPTGVRTSRRFSDDGFEKVKNWLKALRLHKYYTIFEEMNYQEMVSLSGDDLERLGITARGARTKMVKSIQQLRERNEHAGKDLSRLHNDLASGRCGQVITELREMVTVPFPHEGQMAETFAGEFCRILEKAFTRLIIKYAGVTPHPHGAMMHRKCDIVVHLEGGRTPTSDRPAHPRQLQSRSLCRARHHRDLQVASAA